MSGINTSASSTRFAISTGSLDKLYAVFRDDTYTSMNQDAYTMSSTTFSDALLAPYFRFQTLDSEQDRDGTLRFQWQLNNVSSPQYLATCSDALFDLAGYANNLQASNTGPLCTSRQQFNTSHGVFTLVCNCPDEPISLASGYDMRGQNAQIQFQVQGQSIPSSKSYQCFVTAEVTQEIRVGLGGQVAVSS